MELNRYFEIKIYGVSNELAAANGELLNTTDNQTILVLRTNDSYINNPQYFGIAEGSMNLEEILCDGEFELGTLCSDKFEVELFNISEDLSGLDITVDVTENEVISRLFTGVIDSSTTDNNNYTRKITAYDKGYFLRDKDCVEIWDNFWESSESKTLKGLRDYLISQLGITTNASTLPNDDFVVNHDLLTSISFGDLIKMIVELQGAIPHFDREGVLQFIQITNAPSYSFTSDDYEAGSVDFEDYTTQQLTGVKLYSTSDNLTQEYKPSSSNDNAYIISGNIFLLDSDESSVNTALKNVYESGLNYLSYSPATIPMIVSNLNLSLGMMFTTPKANHYILSQTFSGSLLIEQEIKCEASGETREQTASSTNNSMVQGKKFSKMEQTIDRISTEVSETTKVATAAKETADKVNITLITKYSTTEQTAESIKQAVSESKTEIENDVNTTLTKYSTTEQTAASIKLAVSQSKTEIEGDVANTYATKASLDLYVKENEASSKVASWIEASADNIIIKYTNSLIFGNYPNGQYMQARTNDSNNGVLFKGTGTYNIYSVGEFDLRNYEDSNFSTIRNRINVGKQSSTSNTFVDIINGNYTGSWRYANNVNLWSTSSQNMLNLVNYDMGNNVIRNSLGLNCTSSTVSFELVNKKDGTYDANRIRAEYGNSSSLMYLSNFQYGNTNVANQLNLNAVSNSNIFSLTNYKSNSSRMANYINLSAGSGSTTISISNEKLNVDWTANFLQLSSKSSQALTVLGNYQVAGGYSKANVYSAESNSTSSTNTIEIWNNKYGNTEELANKITMSSKDGLEITNGYSSIVMNMSGNNYFNANNGLDLIVENDKGYVIIRTRGTKKKCYWDGNGYLRGE